MMHYSFIIKSFSVLTDIFLPHLFTECHYSDESLARAKFVLELRSGTNTTSNEPTKGKGFYPFEEDLPHHISEALVIVSTGCAMSFFGNAYVRDWLRNLNPAHRPIYRQKFLRILRVIQYVLNKEISLMLKELYLLYTESFVASTSDFWWHPVMKQSFGACIANFMANRYSFKNG